MSPRSSDLLWPLECRTCHDRALVHVTDISDPENFQVVHRCKVCGYLNVIGQHRVILPISESLRSLTAPSQDSLRAALAAFGAESSGRALRGLLESYVQHLDALVKQQPQDPNPRIRTEGRHTFLHPRRIDTAREDARPPIVPSSTS